MAEELAADTGFGEIAWVRVTDPKLTPARSWSIPKATYDETDGLRLVKDEPALGQDQRPAPPNYEYKSGSAASKES